MPFGFTESVFANHAGGVSMPAQVFSIVTFLDRTNIPVSIFSFTTLAAEFILLLSKLYPLSIFSIATVAYDIKMSISVFSIATVAYGVKLFISIISIATVAYEVKLSISIFSIATVAYGVKLPISVFLVSQRVNMSTLVSSIASLANVVIICLYQYLVF